jgi:RNA polymerase sigma-70 factor (ECF subfamily)
VTIHAAAAPRPVHDGGCQPTVAGEALECLMGRYETRIYTFTLTLLSNPDLALDCTQDTFLRAYLHLAKGREVTGSWLYAVARNRVMDEFRHRRNLADADELEHWEAPEAPTDLRLTVQATFARLQAVDREVLYLFGVAGFRTEEIGDMLGIRGSAVRQRLYRARHHFRAMYDAGDGISNLDIAYE